jgi:acrylyl-CoA reductase (NADPH)
MFSALVLDRNRDDQTVTIQRLDAEQLPDVGDEVVTVDVLYSSLNYKDALAVTGAGPIIRGDYPIVPGIDLVGRVLDSQSDAFAVGDHVIGTGWELGEVVWGGYTQRARVDGHKLVSLPASLTPRQAMIAGTAGLTAMLSVMALEEHDVHPEDGEVVVTGASGGVGILALTLLDALGYELVASSGSDAREYLRARGADRVVSRAAFEEGPDRPLETGKWAGAVDAVGGNTLATIIAQLQRHGSVAAFGNAAAADLETSVFPFILRGVNLLGIDSNTCPNDRRRTAWRRIGSVLSDEDFEAVHARTIALDAVPEASRMLLEEGVRGRVLVDLRG